MSLRTKDKVSPAVVHSDRARKDIAGTVNGRQCEWKLINLVSQRYGARAVGSRKNRPIKGGG